MNRVITPVHAGTRGNRLLAGVSVFDMRSRHHACPARAAVKAGGASRDRTGDLLVANQALSQLSYGPSPISGGSGRSCTSDLTLIRGAL